MVNKKALAMALKELRDELGDDLRIVAVGDKSTDEFIEEELK